MKKILLTMVLLAVFSIGSKADRFFVQGSGTYFSTNWGDGDRMTNQDGRHYLVKKFEIIADETTVLFIIHRTTNGGRTNGFLTYDNFYSSTPSRTDPEQNASLYFKKKGTYWVVFTIDQDPLKNDQTEYESIETVILAEISADTNNNDTTPLWDKLSMTFNEVDNKFHASKDVIDVAAGKTGKFTAKVYHRSTDSTPVDYGVNGVNDSNPLSVNFTEFGRYQMDFTLDPIMKNAPKVTVRGYHDLTIGSYGYSTLSYNKVLDIPSSSTVVIINGQNNGTFTTEEVFNKIPKTTTTPQAGTGVIVIGNAGAKNRFYWSEDQMTSVTLAGNKLYGTGSSSYAPTPNETYCFTDKNNVVGFYLATSGAYPANKAFLFVSDFSSGGGTREFYGINFGNEETAISKNEAPQHAGIYFNLQGQPVEHPTKGLYIVGGRKVLVK